MNKVKTKKVGFIKTGAVIPFFLVFGIIVVFNIFFLESIIKSKMEDFASNANGSEVNVESVKISFLNLDFRINKIQISDAKNLEFNAYEIGAINFAMSWDALLRGKILIDEASVNDIIVNSKRSRIAKIIGAKKTVNKVVQSNNIPQPQNAAPQEIGKNNDAESDEDLFGEISKLTSNLNTEQLINEMQDKLKSKAYFDSLKVELKQKETELTGLLSSLKSDDNFKILEKRAKDINFNDLKDLKKAPKIIKEIDDIKDDANKEIKNVKEAIKKIKSEISYVESAIKKGESLVKEDLSNVDQFVKTPNLEAKSIAKSLFGPEMAGRMEQFEGYFNKAKEYMPPKKDKVATVKQARGRGVNYQFGTPNSYPLFWLKLAKVDSKSSQADISGVIEHISTDQSITNKPTHIKLAGNFLEKNILGFSIDSVLDHRRNINDSIDLKIEKAKFSNFALSKSNDVKFNIKDAFLKSNVNFKFIDGLVNISTKNSINEISYDIKAKADLVDEILNNIARDTPTVDLNGQINGTFSNLNYDLKSSLATSVKASFERQLKAKIQGMKNKFKSDLEAKLGGSKTEVENKLLDLKNKHLQDLSGKEDMLKKLTDDLLKKKSGSKPDPLKSLKKKFKFK